MKITLLTIHIVLKMISFDDCLTIIVSSASKKKNMNTPSILNDVTTRLAALRQEMKGQAIDALIVPTSDPHLSEYLPLHWRSREWLSGFTGSAGIPDCGNGKGVVVGRQPILDTSLETAGRIGD